MRIGGCYFEEKPLSDPSLQHRLRDHLQHITRDRDPYFATAGHFYVQHYIQTQWAEWGKTDSHTFRHRGQTHRNLILNLPSTSSRPPILIGAHYDTVPGSPGADDNGTGIAVLLELARLLATDPPRHPIRLVAFDLEELGWVGSQHYATQLHQNGQRLRLMICLEMLGYCDRTPHSQRYPAGLERLYPNQGDFIALVGNLRALPDLLSLSRTLRRIGTPCEWLPAGHRGLIVPATRRSDHVPFWDLGYRAVMVTDTADLRNPHYHRASDRLETIDLPFLTGVCQGLAEGIRRL
jgi:Zn-dependent M28 family amino/carboxypeptidase